MTKSDQLLWWTSRGHSEELALFAINYAKRFHPHQDPKKVFQIYHNRILMNFQVAVVRHNEQSRKENEQPYEPKNNVERFNKPSWLGKGIDRDLFK